MIQNLNNTKIVESSFIIALSQPPTVLSVSEGIDRLLGFKANDFLDGSISLQSRIHDHDQDIADDLFSSDIELASGTFNIRLRHADGRIRCVKGHYAKSIEGSGNSVTLTLLLQDAKSLWRQQEEQNMMANFKAMMDNTDDYIYFKDRNHVFNGASQALVKITQSTQHWTEFLGLTDYDVFLEEYADIYYSLEKEVFAGVDVAHDIQATLLQDGKKGWVNNRKYPIRNNDGEIIGLFGIARDITELKKAEEIQAKEMRLSLANLHNGIGIWDLDFQTMEMVWDDSMFSLYNIKREDFPSAANARDKLLHPDDIERIENEIQEAVSARKSLDAEFRVVWLNGEVHHIKAVAKIFYDGNGMPLRMLGTNVDITDSKQSAQDLKESKAQISKFFELDLVGLSITSPEKGWIRINDCLCEMLEYSEPELKKTTWVELTHPDDLASDNEQFSRLLANEIDGYTLEKRFISKTGKVIPTQLVVRCIRKENGEVDYVMTMVQDITLRKQAENNLLIAATAFESQEGMVVADVNSIILRVNQAFMNITGYSAEDAVGQTLRFLFTEEQDSASSAAIWESISNTNFWDGEILSRRKNGEIFPEHLTITSVKDVKGVVTNYVATISDITSSKAALEEIQRLAFHDSLTQLPNRRLLYDRLKQALSISARNGLFSGFLYLDLDHFKILNDTLGHDVGDLLLQQVAVRLTACVREGDTVARLGGDEFVVLLEGLSGNAVEVASQIQGVAEKILCSIDHPYQLNARTYHIRASIGATLFNNHDYSGDDILKQADIAMYQSKSDGRNAIRFFDPKMQDAITAKMDLENELHKAIEQQQFQLYYQIQINSIGQVLGAEALIRWMHPERGMILPLNFIPLAEGNGLIIPIGQWVLDTACAQLKKWQQDPLTQDLILAVNVSAKQFHRNDFVAQVLETIDRHEINPAHLKLELTESMLVDNITDIIRKMEVLSRMGVLFSLDDFGTGYSSLQYLKKLPLDQLKIDQSFVRDILTDASDRAIVRTIISMAHSLDIKVIAEGIEVIEQQQLLLNKGCANFQGYLFGKPVLIDEFEALLRKRRLTVSVSNIDFSA